MNREILPASIIALMFFLAFYVEPMLQLGCGGKMIGHWGITGMPDGWVDKNVGLFLIPALSLVIYLVLLIIPKIEVYKKNMRDFDLQFWGFRVVFVFVMGVIYVASLLPNMGYPTDTLLIVISGVAVLFFYVGYMLNYTKRNYFVGVRTPWTLANEKVWEKTNRLAGRLFWVCGALCLVSLVTPAGMRLWFVLAPIILLVIATTVYSYLEYRKVKKGQADKASRRRKKK